jgi:hypothetical protein
MHKMKQIFTISAKWAKPSFWLPEFIMKAVKERQRQVELAELETERLDRIRNPLKYRGK